jgi:4-amino-4-deoxy-L-arabinose transferase-like glycosyltransferase
MTIIAGKAREHWGILVILIAFMVISYFHATLTPLFVKPDEEWHFAYIVHIRQTGSLPAATERTAYEGYQAPLYYILASLISWPFSLEDVGRLYNPNPHFLSTLKGNYNLFAPCPARAANVASLARFLSLLFGIIVIGTTYRMGLRFLHKDVALMGSAGVAFLPTFAFIATAVSNDLAVAALATLTILVGVETIVEGFTMRRGLLFGLLAGMATLSKINGLILFALLPYLIWMSPGRLQSKIKTALVAFVGLLLPLPWFVRNWILFGDPLNLYGLSPRPHDAPLDMGEMVSFIWKSFWLDFSVGRLAYAPSWVYWIYGTLSIVGIAGMFKLLIGGKPVRGLKSGQKSPYISDSPIRAIAGLFLLQVLLTLIPQLLLAMKHFTGGGRYLLVAVAGWMLLIATGVQKILPYRCTPLAWCLVMFALALFALLRVLIPGYYPTIMPDSDAMEPLGYLESQIGLVYFTYDKQVLSPGETLTVEIIWKPLQAIPESYSIFVQLLGKVGETEQPLAQVDTYPGSGYYPTCRWRVGEMVRDRYYLRLPDYISFSGDSARLVAGMYRFYSMERLKAYWQRDGYMERAYQDAFTLGVIKLQSPGIAQP